MTTKTTLATPLTPWTYDGHNVKDADGNRIVIEGFTLGMSSRPSTAATTELILRAVNTHAAAKEALRKALKYAELADSQWDGANYHGTDELLAELREVLKRMDATSDSTSRPGACKAHP